MADELSLSHHGHYHVTRVFPAKPHSGVCSPELIISSFFSCANFVPNINSSPKIPKIIELDKRASFCKNHRDALSPSAPGSPASSQADVVTLPSSCGFLSRVPWAGGWVTPTSLPPDACRARRNSALPMLEDVPGALGQSPRPGNQPVGPQGFAGVTAKSLPTLPHAFLERLVV